MGCTAKQTMEGTCTDYRGLSKSEREERIKKDLTNKQLEKERIKQLSIARNDTKKLSKEGDLELTIKRIIKAPLIYLRFMGLSENQARIIYFSLIGVGGYFAYKKFKK